MTLSRLLITPILAAAFLICACDRAPVERKAKFHFWGKEWQVQTMRQSDADVRNMGRAVGWVSTPFGGGSGFFVSSDGLFFTNEHVLPRNHCSEARCGGVRIIRHFTPGGDIKVYTNFRVIAQSEEEDFALLKVDLGQEHSVPYLDIDFEDTSAMGARLVTLGHPYMAPLRGIPMDFFLDLGRAFLVNGPTMRGMSGGPVINRDTGRVIGLIQAIQHSEDREGTVTGRGRVVPMRRVLAGLRRVYPNVASSRFRSQLRFAPEIFSADRNAPAIRSIFPSSANEHIRENQIPLAQFIGVFLGDSLEGPALEKFAEPSLRSLYPAESLMQTLDSLSDLQLLSGRRVNWPEPLVARIDRAIQDLSAFERRKVQLLWRRLRGSLSAEACVAAVRPNRSSLPDPSDLMNICLTPTVDGVDVTAILYAGLEEATAAKQGARLSAILYAAVKQRTVVAPVDAFQAAQLREVLAMVVRESPALNLAFQAEGLMTLLEKNPTLAGFRAFSETFERAPHLNFGAR